MHARAGWNVSPIFRSSLRAYEHGIMVERKRTYTQLSYFPIVSSQWAAPGGGMGGQMPPPVRGFAPHLPPSQNGIFFFFFFFYFFFFFFLLMS